jgi:hypothetical protein
MAARVGAKPHSCDDSATVLPVHPRTAIFAQGGFYVKIKIDERDSKKITGGDRSDDSRNKKNPLCNRPQ